MYKRQLDDPLKGCDVDIDSDSDDSIDDDGGISRTVAAMPKEKPHMGPSVLEAISRFESIGVTKSTRRSSHTAPPLVTQSWNRLPRVPKKEVVSQSLDRLPPDTNSEEGVMPLVTERRRSAFRKSFSRVEGGLNIDPNDETAPSWNDSWGVLEVSFEDIPELQNCRRVGCDGASLRMTDCWSWSEKYGKRRRIIASTESRIGIFCYSMLGMYLF